MLVPLETIWSEIRKAHDPVFLEHLLQTDGARVFAFGGIVRDTSLGKPWKDLDLKVVWPVSYDERKRVIEQTLKETATMLQTVEFRESDGIVFRITSPREKQTVIDVSVTGAVEHFPPDFKACALFVDLQSGEVVELGPSCLKDFENGAVRPLNDDYEQALEQEPHLLFRAVKLAAQTGWTIDPQFAEAIRRKKHLIRKAISHVLDYLKQNGKDSFGEYNLGNIFGGLKSNPVRYVQLFSEHGLLEESCRALQEAVCNEHNELKPVQMEASLADAKTIEEKVSLFLSSIAKSISNNPSVCFESLKKAFALDTDRSDGNEFPIDPTKINFVA